MSVTFRQVGPCAAAEVEGIDLRQTLSLDHVAPVHTEMDECAVLVFHDQTMADDQHLAFSPSLSLLKEPTRANLRAAYDALPAETRTEIENVIWQRSQILSRQRNISARLHIGLSFQRRCIHACNGRVMARLARGFGWSPSFRRPLRA